MRIITPAFCTLLSLLVTTVSGQADTGYIRGFTEDEYGNPLPGVSVTITDLTLQPVQSTLSGSDGSFLVAIPASLSHYIELSSSMYPVQYWSYTQTTATPDVDNEVMVMSGDTMDMYAQLLPLDTAGMLQGEVVDYATFMVRQGVRIELYNADDVSAGPIDADTTDTYGEFFFDNLHTTHYFVHIPASDSFPSQWYSTDGNTAEPIDTVRIDQTGYLTVVLETSLSDSTRLTLWILEDTIAVADGAVVTLFDQFDATQPIVQDTTDSLGYVHFFGLGETIFFVRISSFGQYPAQWFHYLENTHHPYRPVNLSLQDRTTISLTTSPVPADSKVEVLVTNAVFDSTDFLECRLLRDNGGAEYDIADRIDTKRFLLKRIRAGNYAIQISSMIYPEQYYDPNGNTLLPVYSVFLSGTDSLSFETTLLDTPVFNGRIAGFVRDTAGYAISGATLGLYGTDNLQQALNSTITDTDGFFEFTGIENREYFIFIESIGPYPPQWFDYGSNSADPITAIMTGSYEDYDIWLTPNPTVSSTGMMVEVYDTAGNPTDIGDMYAIRCSDSTWFFGVRDSNQTNHYHFDDITEGSYIILAENFGFPAQYFHPDGNTVFPAYCEYVGYDMYVPVTMYLTPDPRMDTTTGANSTGSVSGIVRDVNNIPMAGVMIEAVETNKTISGLNASWYDLPVAWSFSGADGSYILHDLSPGDYLIHARSDTVNVLPQYYWKSDTRGEARILHVELSELSGVDFSLREGGVVTGIVRDTNGMPLPGISVVLDSDKSWLVHDCVTGADGRFTLKGLHGWRWSLGIHDDVYYCIPGDSGLSIDVIEGSTTSTPDLIASPGGFVSGTVTIPATLDTSGTFGQFRNAQIFLYRTDLPEKNGDPHPGWTSWIGHDAQNQAAFSSDPCPPGEWLMVVSPMAFGQVRFDHTLGKQFVEHLGWSFTGSTRSFLSAQTVTVTAGQTTDNLSCMLPAGYSVFGRFDTTFLRQVREQNGGFAGKIGVAVLTKVDNRLIQISHNNPLPDGRFELPGLYNESEYYLLVHAPGFQPQYWSPEGVSSKPDKPYYFSTVNFSPVVIALHDIPTDEPSGNIHVDGSYSSGEAHFVVELSHNDLFNSDGSPRLDSLSFWYMDRFGQVEVLTSWPVLAGHYRYEWLKTAAEAELSGSYCALGKGANLVVRSYPRDVEFRNHTLLSSDSLWIDIHTRLGEVSVFWGAGAGYTRSDADAVVLYRRESGTTFWDERNREGVWHTRIDDNDLSSGDGGKTFEYKVSLLRGGLTLRSSPAVSVYLSDSLVTHHDKDNYLWVGEGEEFGTIQSAIDAAYNDDVIIVLSGVYAENITTRGKSLTLHAVWSNGNPPVLDALSGTAITIPFPDSSGRDNTIRIGGFKITNAAVGILTKDDTDIEECLFTEVHTAVKQDFDSVATVDAIRNNPFLSNGRGVQVTNCTFIGTNGTLVYSSQTSSLADNTSSAGWSGWEAVVPKLSLESNLYVRNAVFADYASSYVPVMLLGSGASAHIEYSNFWNTSRNTTLPNLFMASTNTGYDPHFTSSVWYFLPDDSPLRNLPDNGNGLGYDGRRFDDDGYSIPLPPVTHFFATPSGFNAVTCSWSPPDSAVSFDRYLVFRLPGDSSEWFVDDDNQWQPRMFENTHDIPEDSIFALIDTFPTRDTMFVDTTAVPGDSYVYAVAAVDSPLYIGEVDMPYPPALSNYVIKIGYDGFESVKTVSLPANTWTMIGPWGGKQVVIPDSIDCTVYQWNDTIPPDKLLAHYQSVQVLTPGKGYWAYTGEVCELSVSLASYDSVFTTQNNRTVTLRKGATGWNQIGSPFPFPVQPQWLAGYDLYTWDAKNRRYELADCLKPWQAAWIHTNVDTVLPVSPTAVRSQTTTAAAKRRLAVHWEIQVSLTAPSSADPDNYFGTVPFGKNKAGIFNGPEPPPAFDYPHLYFVDNSTSESAPEKPAHCARLYKAGASVPQRALEWMTAVSPSRDSVRLIVKNPASLPSALHLFWVKSGEVTNCREHDTIYLPPSGNPFYGYFVATANPLDIALYTSTFAMHPNFPNPFSHHTTIEYVVPYSWNNDGTRKPGEFQPVSIQIFSLSGRLVTTLVSGDVPVGIHRVVWDGTGNHGRPLPAGVYVSRMKTGKFMQSMKMFRVR